MEAKEREERRAEAAESEKRRRVEEAMETHHAFLDPWEPTAVSTDDSKRPRRPPLLPHGPRVRESEMETPPERGYFTELSKYRSDLFRQPDEPPIWPVCRSVESAKGFVNGAMTDGFTLDASFIGEALHLGEGVADPVSVYLTAQLCGYRSFWQGGEPPLAIQGSLQKCISYLLHPAA